MSKTETAAPSPAFKLYREKQLLTLLPFSKTTLWKMVREGKFPKPVKLSPRVTAWRESDVQAHLAQQATA